MAAAIRADLAYDLACALDPSLLMERCGFGPDGWQTQLLRSAARRILLLCGRQTGKSTTTAALALHEAIYRPSSLVLLLSPSLRQSQELFKIVTRFYGLLETPVPADQESALRLELNNGSRIISLPGTESTVRGYSGVRLLVVDEAARVPDELYFTVRPMLAVSGGRMVCLSTPFGKRGFFYDEWTRGQGWEKIRIPATECARIAPEFLAEERTALGDWWYRQEYLCEFVETVDQIFNHDLVMQALDPTVQPLWERS